MKTLELKVHQIDHFTRIIDILDVHSHYMDFSRMGTGKTYSTSKVSETLGLPLCVVCPVSAMNAWKEMQQYGINIHFLISYQSLRGTERYPPKHGYLNRTTEIKADKKGNEKKRVVFTPTDKFLSMINDGILLVFDEGQNIKNDSDQGKAARALSGAIRSPSKCAFISGSPYDKEEHSENILRFLSIITHKRLIWSNPLTGEKVPKGLLEVLDYCTHLDPVRTKEILDDQGGSIYVTASKARSICHHLFITVVKDHLYSEMMPEISKYPIHMEESYLYMNDDELKALKSAIGALSDATRFNGKDVDMEQIEWGAVTLAMKAVETSMINPLYRYALSILSKDKSSKVIISVSYIDSITELCSLLQGYNPLWIDGSVKTDDRTRRVNLFNTNEKHRILISTIKTGGVSISLHDTVGNAPRHYLLVPTYSIIDIYQASGRIHRTGLMSDAYFYMIYGTDAPTKDSDGNTIEVTPILNALSKKKDVLKGLITKQSSVYKLPGEFPKAYYNV